MKEQQSNPEKGILAVDWVIAIKILSILESRHHHRIYDTLILAIIISIIAFSIKKYYIKMNR